jgi:hypothetical protein
VVKLRIWGSGVPDIRPRSGLDQDPDPDLIRIRIQRSGPRALPLISLLSLPTARYSDNSERLNSENAIDVLFQNSEHLFWNIQ